MKTIKKSFLAILCLSVILSVTACGARDNNTGDNMTNDATENTDYRDDMTDNNIGDSIGNGVDNVGNAIDDGMNAVGDGIENMTDDLTGNDENTRMKR